MIRGEEPKIFHMVIIAGRKQKEPLLKSLSNSGGHFINLYYGRGSVKAAFLMNAFGLVAEENKVMITCLLSRREADEVFSVLISEFHFDKPNTGIAYTLPVEKLSY